MEAEARKILIASSTKELAEPILTSFKEVEKNFTLSSWKTSELDAGHFVEAIRRLIEEKLFGSHTPIGKSLPPLNQKEMNRYESATGHESYRMHIPRLLLGIYGIRNKRGVGHLSKVSPNYMDANYVVSACKWVLAEVVRLESGKDARATAKLIDQVVDRNIEGIWTSGDTTRILADGLSLKESILFLLFEASPRQDDAILKIIEYDNDAYYRRTLKKLHAERLLEYADDGSCTVTPKGRLEAEKIINKKVV